MSNDIDPAPAGAADGQQTGVPPTAAVPAATGKPSDGADSGSADTTTHDQQASARVEFLRDLGLEQEPQEEPEAEAKEDPPPADQKPETPPTEAAPTQDGEQKPEPTDEPLKPEQEAQLHSFGRKRIKNLEKQLAERDQKIAQADEAIRGMNALQSVAQQAGFDAGPRAIEAMVLMGKAVNGRDPEALAEIGKRLVAAGWKPPQAAEQTPTAEAEAPKLDAEAEADLAEIEALMGPEAAARQRKRLSAARKPEPPPQEQPPAKSQAHAPIPPEELSARTAMRSDAERVQAALGQSAPAVLQEIAQRVAEADAKRLEEEGQGLPPKAWATVFKREVDAALARHRQHAARKAPTSERPSSSTSAKTGIMAEILGD